jgi:hypothetical protein
MGEADLREDAEGRYNVSHLLKRLPAPDDRHQVIGVSRLLCRTDPEVLILRIELPSIHRAQRCEEDIEKGIPVQR